METIRVKYIGKAPVKHDNVCRTSLYWPFAGAICIVQADIAHRLFAHTETWVEAADDDEGKQIVISGVGKLDSNLTRDEKIKIAIDILVEYEAFAEVNAFLGEDMLDIPDEDGKKGEADTAPIPIKAGLSSVKKVATGFSPDQNESVIEAIKLLNLDDEEHFTKEGIPRVEAISGLLGHEITAEERTSAWDEMLKADEESTKED